jgi:hypothetical protein
MGWPWLRVQDPGVGLRKLATGFRDEATASSISYISSPKKERTGCRKILCAGAFSGKVDTGFPQKMRPLKESRALFRFSPIGTRSRSARIGTERNVKFRVELIWKDGDDSAASSIFLTSDGRVILQGRAVSREERLTLALPAAGDMISVDRNLIRAIKEML